LLRPSEYPAHRGVSLLFKDVVFACQAKPTYTLLLLHTQIYVTLAFFPRRHSLDGAALQEVPVLDLNFGIK
jgi:hypothetical protein